MLKKILFVLLAAVVFLLVVGLFLPTTYHVERSIVVDAAPASIHPLVNNLERWDEWEPWTADDPTIAVTRGSVTTGVGASQSWTSKSGDGQLAFTDSDPKTGVVYSLLFDNQFKSVGKVYYEPLNTGDAVTTQVTWSLTGGEDAPKVIGGYFALAMDGMVGPIYERGLAKLRDAVEQRSPAN